MLARVWVALRATLLQRGLVPLSCEFLSLQSRKDLEAKIMKQVDETAFALRLDLRPDPPAWRLHRLALVPSSVYYMVEEVCNFSPF